MSVQTAPDAIGDALTQLGGELPKTFGATKTMSVSDGHRLLYAARDPEQLHLDPEEAARLMAANRASTAGDGIVAGDAEDVVMSNRAVSNSAAGSKGAVMADGPSPAQVVAK